MADVIIKGMEMPENCNECRLLGEGRWCWAIPVDETQPGATREDRRPNWCPLRPAPEWRSTITDPPKPGQIIAFMGFGETTGSGMLLDKMQVTFWKSIPKPPDGGDGDG